MESRKTEIDARINGEIYLGRSAPQLVLATRKYLLTATKGGSHEP